MTAIAASTAPPAETYTDLYTVPANSSATVSVAACNTSDKAALIRIAIRTAAGDPVAADFIEHGLQLTASGAPGGPLVRTGEVLTAGARLIVWASGPNVAFRIAGFEGAA